MTSLATTVHYRRTKSFDSQLGHRASEWSVSRHEAARRLAALANFNLSLDDHDRVVELATTLGVGFVQAATALATIGDRKELIS